MALTLGMVEYECYLNRIKLSNTKFVPIKFNYYIFFIERNKFSIDLVLTTDKDI